MRATLIGLDTSHAVTFTKFLQDPQTPEEQHVNGMKITGCLRFDTPFQSKDGLDQRQKYLESQGVTVTENFERATADCDAILLTIDDASFHLEYFLKCVKLGKPIYIDKPFADTLAHTHRMIRAAQEYNVRVFTASALRFDGNIEAAARQNPNPTGVFVYGALGDAPSGSSVVWYAVHCFEILEKIMGRGAVAVTMLPDPRGALCHVAYQDGRRGCVEFIRNTWLYGGIIHGADGTHVAFRHSTETSFYVPLLRECVNFFRGESRGVPLEDSLEIMGIIDAADRSMKSGRTEVVYL